MPDKTPIRMLHDRVLVQLDKESGERRSTGGIVIPATAALGNRRLGWAKVAAVGPNARVVEIGDRDTIYGHAHHPTRRPCSPRCPT